MKIREIVRYSLVVFVAIAFVSVFGISYTSGSSMYPTISDGDVLLINRLAKPSIDSVVIIWSDELSKDLCKRVVGVEGDQIGIHDGSLVRNGKIVEDGFDKSYGKEVETVVGKNEIFVLGDNRNNSTDSRELGSLSLDDLKGVLVVDFHINKVVFNFGVAVTIAVLLFLDVGKVRFKKLRKGFVKTT